MKCSKNLERRSKSVQIRTLWDTSAYQRALSASRLRRLSHKATILRKPFVLSFDNPMPKKRERNELTAKLTTKPTERRYIAGEHLRGIYDWSRSYAHHLSRQGLIRAVLLKGPHSKRAKAGPGRVNRGISKVLRIQTRPVQSHHREEKEEEDTPKRQRGRPRKARPEEMAGLNPTILAQRRRRSYTGPSRTRSAPGLEVAGTAMNLRLASHYHLHCVLQAQFELPSGRLNRAKTGPTSVCPNFAPAKNLLWGPVSALRHRAHRSASRGVPMTAAICAIIKCDTVYILGTWLGPKRRGPALRALRHPVHPPSMSSRLSCVWSTYKRNERTGSTP